MAEMLFDHEWELLLQIVNDIHCCSSYTEVCQTIIKQLPMVISFKKVIIFRYGTNENRGKMIDPQGYGPSDYSPLMNGNYPQWTEYLVSPNSAVFRHSDKHPPSEWENTDMYHDFWEPNNIYWTLMTSLMYQNCPIAFIGMSREKNGGDFTEHDIYIMKVLKPTLELKLYMLLANELVAENPVFSHKIYNIATLYNLTKQEAEITRMICCHKTNQEICKELVIAPATLNKHISNVFYKTNVNNRIQLIDLITNTK